MDNEALIIAQCKANNPNAQRSLYEAYSPVMFGLCLRYASDYTEAEDVLQEAFVKILTKIDKYSGLGSFEGWMKRVVINTAITHFHQSGKHKHHFDITEVQDSSLAPFEFEDLEFTAEEMMGVVTSLPDGYRMVFNLYAIEGYKHKEIAEMLGIDVSTSKSQYSRARKIIQQRLEELQKDSLKR
ncbi:MAG: hypothetical protein RIS47_884 [Bacteroidota bacterium]|jgi:RNA polymerase sigma-70 factor (ECF subfamily)